MRIRMTTCIVLDYFVNFKKSPIATNHFSKIDIKKTPRYRDGF